MEKVKDVTMNGTGPEKALETTSLKDVIK